MQLLEAQEKLKWSYTGPVYRFAQIIDTINEPLYTYAVSKDKANSNFCFQLKNRYGLNRNTNLTIDIDNILLENDIAIIPDVDEYEIIEPDSHEPGINDSKYNFDDPDREGNYEIESFN